MILQENETYAAVVKVQPAGQGNYKITLCHTTTGDIEEWLVHEETVLDYRLVVGKQLDQSTFRALKSAKDGGMAYGYAVGILKKRMYTEKEMRQKLVFKKVAQPMIDEVITKLLDLELLNDERYAQTYIESQIGLGKKSQQRIIADLRTKGVAISIIDDQKHLFDKQAEQKLMQHEIEKAYYRYLHKGLSDFEIKNKVMGALGRKGFDFYEAKRQYSFFIEDL